MTRYTHIATAHAQAIASFFQEHLNPYLNFHRPCGVPELVVNAKGKEKRAYRWYATPWEILRQLPDVASHLKAGVTIATLDQLAQATSDTQAAEEMQQAKRKLFGSFQGSVSQAAMRLPLVGRGEAAALRPSKTKTFLEGKPTPLGDANSLPLVGPGTQKSKQ
jgi:hypothetical protein